MLDYPAVFAEWLGAGMKVLATGKTKEDEKVDSAAERGAMIQVFFRILEWTPDRKPFLEGETYKGIPALLVPRILYKEKGIAHMGNWILAYQYEYLTAEELGRTSVGFDLLSEAYANYGYVGIGFLAVGIALFYGWVSRLSTGVPLLSTRFLFAVLVLSGTLSSNNTMGVFVTTLWQSTMALLTVSLILTKKEPNPLHTKSEFLARRGQGKSQMRDSLVRSAWREVDREKHDGQESRRGLERSSIDHQPEELRGVEAEAISMKHERPTRVVYGEKKESKK